MNVFCALHPFFYWDGHLTDYFLCHMNVVYAMYFPICCVNFNLIISLSAKVFSSYVANIFKIFLCNFTLGQYASTS